MKSLEQIEAFVKVVEFGSFTRAADKLNISNAAMSKKISTLEAELNCSLLNRTTRHIALTNLGEVFYRQCKHIISLVDESYHLISDAHLVPRGRLCVFLHHERFFIPYIEKFCDLYPDIELEIQIAERLPNLYQESIDIIIGASYHDNENLVRKKIGTTRYCLCASPQYLKKYGTPKSVIELHNHRCLEHLVRYQHKLDFIQDGKESIMLKPAILINKMSALIDCALSHQGIIKSHYEYVESLINDKKLVEVLPAATKTPMPLYLYYPYARYVEPKIKAIVDFVSDNNIGYELP